MGSHRVGHKWSDLACLHALEKEMATHSSILAWRIPGTEEPGWLLSMESHRVRYHWSNLVAATAAAAVSDIYKQSEVAQSCPTLCDPVDFSPPGSSVHGILQERILKWVVISSSRRSSQPRNRTCVSCIADRLFTTEPPDIPSLSLLHFKWSINYMAWRELGAFTREQQRLTLSTPGRPIVLGSHPTHCWVSLRWWRNRAMGLTWDQGLSRWPCSESPGQRKGGGWFHLDCIHCTSPFVKTWRVSLDTG